MGTIANAIRSMHSTLRAVAGVTATYSRDTTSQSCSLTVVPARPLDTDEATLNVSISGQRQDFIVQADQIVLGGAVSLPKRGDTLTLTLAGRVQKFRCINPPYRPGDNEQNILRLFTEAIQ